MKSRPQRAAKPQLVFGLSLAALATALGAAPALAQQASPVVTQEADTEEEIVVTGFRASLAAAIDIKREEVAAVDAIVAEDIADFPDANLSESIQRIPGVAITRANGEGRQISVRGLGAQFTRVRLNGMEAMSATGSTDAEGGTNRGRNFDFNVFASDLFNNITVRKTASAEVEEGSLGATVDLRTARPFDYDNFTLAGSLQGSYDDLAETYNPRGAVLISNTWANDTIGALFSLAYSDRNSMEEGASTVRWQSGGFGSAADINPGNDLTAVNAAFHPRIPRYDLYEHTQERIGATFTVQWRPTNQTELTFDVLYADHNVTRSESFLEAPVFSATGATGIADVDVLDYEIIGNTLVYGVFDDVDIRSEYRFDEASSSLEQVSLALEHDFTDAVRASAFYGRSEASHDNPVQTTLLWDRNNIDGYTYDYRADNRLPEIGYGSVNVADPSVWTLSQIRLRPQFVDNTFETLYGDMEFDLSPSWTVRGGLNWKLFEFESVELRRSNGTTANQEGVLPGFTTATATSAYSQILTAGGTTYATPDVNAAADLWGLYDTSIFTMGIEPALGNNFGVEEEDFGGYIQVEWDTELWSIPFRGNLGVRQVDTSQISTGYTFASGLPLLQTVERSYDDTLPSLNLVFEPMTDLLVRFGAADVMTRPNLGQLNPGAAVTVSGANRTVTAGNPQLDPFRARSYDLSIEWYFHPEALLSFAYFYKDVDSFIQTVRETAPFTGNSLGLPDSVAIAACGAAYPATCGPSVDWQYNLPRNTPGGPVEGFEVAVQLPFYFLDGWLSNFGVVANYTHVESEIDYVNATGAVVVTDSLTGLSDESWNATFYYDDGRFSARISGAYRSDYLTTIPGRNSNLSESTASTLNVDFASSYRLNDNLTFLVEGLNLTDEVSDQYLSPDDRSSFYHSYGRQISVGVRYTY